MSNLESPPDPDMTELDICADCRGPIFTGEWSATGCDCKDFCSECGELVSRDVLAPLTLVSGKIVQACATCRSDSDGVPEEIEEEASGAQTVRIEREAISELAARWVDKQEGASA